MDRLLKRWAFCDLNQECPMIFLTGARQVGKTWLAKTLDDSSYHNWDTIEVKKSFIKDPLFFRSEKKIVVFDEIHKRKDWKKLLKGYFDSPHRMENFVVTGSGRFDQYQRGGDSLQGRYNGYKLWPLSFDEIHHSGKNQKLSKPRNWNEWKPILLPENCDEMLLRLGGFPAPFLSGSEQKARRWQDQYLDRLVREDIRDFSLVQRLDQLELMARLLPERVGSPLSHKSLAEDVEVSPVAVKAWMRLFETLFLGFKLLPFHKKIHRAVKKETKWYFEHWPFCEERGSQFENYIAVQLKTACSSWSEQGYGRYELYYLRDQDRREIDFVITKDFKPLALIEAKSSPQNWPTSLMYYTQKLNIPGFLVYPNGPIRRHELGWSIPSASLLNGLIIEVESGLQGNQ